MQLFREESLSPQARAFFARLEAVEPPRFWVPDHFFIECANVFWKSVRRLGHPLAAAQADLKDLTDLPFESVPTRNLAGPSLELAAELGVAAYDAAYLALARTLDAPLITADEALVKKARGSDFEVLWLGEVER
jgi:predicted nucleic acid-binding protein